MLSPLGPGHGLNTAARITLTPLTALQWLSLMVTANPIQCVSDWAPQNPRAPGEVTCILPGKKHFPWKFLWETPGFTISRVRVSYCSFLRTPDGITGLPTTGTGLAVPALLRPRTR